VRLVNRWASRRTSDVRVSFVRTKVRVAAACAVSAALRGWRYVQVAGRVTGCRTRALTRFTRRSSSCGTWVRMLQAPFALHDPFGPPNVLSLSCKPATLGDGDERRAACSEV